MLSRSQINRLYRLYGRGVNRADFETLLEAYFRMVNEGITLTDALGGRNVRRIGELGVSLGFLTRREGVYVPLGTKYNIILTRGNTEIEYSIWAPLWATDAQALRVGRVISEIGIGGTFNIDKIPNVTFQNRSSYTLLIGNTQYEATFIYQWDEKGVCYLRRQRGGRECNTGIRLRRRTFIKRCTWNYGRRYYPPGRIELCKTIRRRLTVPKPPWGLPENLVNNAVRKIRRYIPTATREAIKLAIYAYQRMVEFNDDINTACRITAIATNTHEYLIRRLLFQFRLAGNVDAAGVPRRGNRMYDAIGDYVYYVINTQPYEGKGKETIIEVRFWLWVPIYATEPDEYMFPNIYQIASNIMACIPAGSDTMIVAIARVWGQAQLFQSIMNQVNRANLEDWISGRLDYKTLAEEANAIFQQSSAKPIAKYYSKDKILYSKLFLHNRDKFTIAITHGTKIHTYEGIFRYQWDGDVVCYFKIEGIEHSNEPEYLSCTTGTTYICMSGGFELCSWNFDDMLRYDRSQLDSSSLC